MSARIYATVGRAADNDVVLDDPTVSSHHARLSWSGGALLVEDLSSANGTFVDGQRVKSVRTRPGADLRCGQVALPWSHEGLRALLKAGAGARTLVMPKGQRPSYVCGACGHVGALESGPTPRSLTCGGCGATLRTGTRPQGDRGRGPMRFAVWAALGAAAGLAVVLVVLRPQVPHVTIPTTPKDVREVIQTLKADEHIGATTAQKLAKALTPMDPVTRNAAVKIAARTEGPFHVEQVAEIWSSVRSAWRYVNDPLGAEYFATATETIDNGYVGDCDDFAITLASMVLAIGGKARVVLMDGPEGGHAYAEACVEGDPTKVASALATHYRVRWKKYLAGRKAPSTIAFRTSPDCPIWLNLDWSSIVPGGPYAAERWAVAIYGDGHSEPLAVVAAASDESATGTGTSKATSASKGTSAGTSKGTSTGTSKGTSTGTGAAAAKTE